MSAAADKAPDLIEILIAAADNFGGHPCRYIVERALVIELTRLRRGVPVLLKDLNADTLGFILDGHCQAAEHPVFIAVEHALRMALRHVSPVVLVDLGRQKCFQVFLVFHVVLSVIRAYCPYGQFTLLS